jgi:hypothetical protein
MAFDAHFPAVADQVSNDLGLYQQVFGLYDGQWGAGGDSPPPRGSLSHQRRLAG